ncbi:Crp/Fnr family transcriptional regulator [Winogradskyella maritima]|uniref:Crp/Fnr family transcriptional regulator n=1 Tax=Winogradskyella maritima TaxID=1517766 RepID=A0ABV8ALA9_9FLAO|nr:Crp/Fnr family transcriptional regulator [Winogradskyella maritima]
MENSSETRCENCIIRKLNALNALNKNELKRISDSKVTKRVKKGESIFEEGEKLNGVFCVRSGVSKLSKLSENGKDQIVKLVKKGELLGQRSVITEQSANLKAVALNDMEVCFIAKQEISTNIEGNIKFTKELLLRIADDLKTSEDALVLLGQKTVSERLLELFRYVKDNFGLDADGYLAILLTREDMANIIGTAKEVTIRTISSLKKEGSIETDGKRIKLL